MQMSRWKAINETAKITKITKITRITKFFKASNENRRRNANESMEGHQRNSENYNFYKILQGKQRKSTQMEMSRWKGINETAKITRITKFCMANNKTRRSNETSQRKALNQSLNIFNNVKDSNTWPLISMT